MIIYSEEFKAKIFSEYNEGKLGYHRLAKKHGLTRDAIRGIILRMKRKKHKEDAINGTSTESKVSARIAEFLSTHKPDKETRRLIEDLKLELDFYKIYSELALKEQDDESKKKIKHRALEQMQEQGAKMTRVLKITGVARSSFYHIKNAKVKKHKKDSEVLELIKKLPAKTLLRAGSKRKAKALKVDTVIPIVKPVAENTLNLATDVVQDKVSPKVLCVDGESWVK